MKTLLSLFLLLAVGASAATGIKISEYPNTPVLTNSELFIVAVTNVTPSTNRNISYGQLRSLLASNNFVGSFTGDGRNVSNVVAASLAGSMNITSGPTPLLVTSVVVPGNSNYISLGFNRPYSAMLNGQNRGWGTLDQGVGISVVNQSRASRTNGVIIGDIGDGGDAVASDAIQMGIVRSGWSLLQMRNFQLWTNGRWAPVVNVADEVHTMSMLETGAEGVSVHGFDLANRSLGPNGTIDDGHMMFSVRPYARRVGINDYGLTDGQRDGPWIQFHTPVFGRYWTNLENNTYQTRLPQPMMWLQSPVLTNDMPVIRLETAGGGNARPVEFRASGGTPETNLLISSGSTVMDLVSKAWDGNTWQTVARIYTDTGTSVTSSIPGRITFSVSPDLTANLSNRVTISPYGAVAVDTTDPRAKIHATIYGANGGGLPANVGQPNNHAAIIGDATETLGSSGATYGIIGAARGNGDSGSARAYGGWFSSSAGGSYATEVGLHVVVGDADAATTPAEFLVGSTTVMRLAGNGNLGIGYVAPSERVSVNGNIAASGAIIATNTHLAANLNVTTPGFKSLGTNGVVLTCPDGGSFILRVDNAGTLTTVTNSGGL